MTTKHRQILSIQHLLTLGRPLVVGTIHDAAGVRVLKSITADRPRGLDLLEVRLDSPAQATLSKITKWPLPVIATARHPAEGGAGKLTMTERRRLLECALPWASAVDVELRSSRELASVVAQAHQHGRTVILSHHDFKATPSLSALKKLAARAADEGADLFKVAALLLEPSDLQRLIEFQTAEVKVPVVAMGMGPAGKLSRIVLSGFGAPLCYGWLGNPQVPGQWPGLELRGMLDEVLPE